MIALNVLGRGSSIGALSLCYVYSAELFPTVIRNVGLGSSSLWVRSGKPLMLAGTNNLTVGMIDWFWYLVVWVFLLAFEGI